MSRTALVELVVQEQDTLAFIVTAGQLQPRVIRILQGVDVRAWTQALLSCAMNGSSGSDCLKTIQAPVQSLLDAIEQEVGEGDHLYIVPHGALHLVPFHALLLSNGLLIERNPVAYAPSASVLARVLGRENVDRENHAIVAGDSRGDLIHAKFEAQLVAGLLQVEPVPKRDAGRRQLRDLLTSSKKLRVLHLACHGYFDATDALSSGILTSDNDATGKPAILSARDFLELNLQIDLVAISACESGVSAARPGDEMMGLTRAFLVGGAHSVLASLWKVEDRSTSILMKLFYEAWLTARLSKAEALRTAQRKLMNMTRAQAKEILAGQPETGHRGFSWRRAPPQSGEQPEDKIFASPLYWGAFTLIGDGR